MQVKIRQVIERAIATQFVRDALAAGYRLSVSLERGYDTDEMLLGSTDEAEILEAMFAGDDCHVFIQAAEGPLLIDNNIADLGWVYFVMGNNGTDVICNSLSNVLTESLLSGAEALANKIDEGEFTIIA